MGRGGPPSIIDRLMRRGRKEEKTDEGGDRPPSDEPSKEPTKDPEAGTDTANGDEAGDVLTISEGAGAGGDENVSSDDANDTDGDVLTISDGSTVVAGGDDSTVSTGDAAADDSSGVVSAGEGDTVTDDSSGVVTAGEGDGDVATGEGAAVGGDTGDTDQDSNIATGEGDVVNNGDIDDGTQTGDAIGGDENQQAIDDSGDIDTGTDGDDTGESQSIEGATEAENPINLNLVRNARIGAPKDSSLSDELQELKEATEPQLDPAVVQARLGGRGPKPPDPDGPDETPTDFAFGTGATVQHPLHAVQVPPDVAPDAPEGIPDGPTDLGLDPVGGAPPDDGVPQDATQVQIDDPGPHNDSTEVDID